MRISDWSSDVCSSDLGWVVVHQAGQAGSHVGITVGAQLTAHFGFDLFFGFVEAFALFRLDLVGLEDVVAAGAVHDVGYTAFLQSKNDCFKIRGPGAFGDPADRKSTRLNSSH